MRQPDRPPSRGGPVLVAGWPGPWGERPRPAVRPAGARTAAHGCARPAGPLSDTAGVALTATSRSFRRGGGSAARGEGRLVRLGRPAVADGDRGQRRGAMGETADLHGHPLDRAAGVQGKATGKRPLAIVAASTDAAHLAPAGVG